MSGKSDTLEYNLLRLIFNGVGITSLASSVGTTALWVGLHTADPTDEASTANEGYTGYARVQTQRSTAGWSVTSGTSATKATAAPVANIDFAQNTSTSTGTIGYASVWMSSDASSSGCLYVGTLSPVMYLAQNTFPRITTGSSFTED